MTALEWLLLALFLTAYHLLGFPLIIGLVVLCALFCVLRLVRGERLFPPSPR